MYVSAGSVTLTIHRLIAEISWKIFLSIFHSQWSDQVTNLHTAGQLHRYGFCKHWTNPSIISYTRVAWIIILFGSWAHKKLVKWVLDLMDNTAGFEMSIFGMSSYGWILKKRFNVQCDKWGLNNMAAQYQATFSGASLKKKTFSFWFTSYQLCPVNSLRPSDAIWRHGTGSTLAQVMACCLAAPSHYLNQCWLIISRVLWHSSDEIIIKRSEDTSL